MPWLQLQEHSCGVVWVFLQNKERGHNNVTKEELESCMINQVTFVLYHTYRCTTGLGLEGKIGRKSTCEVESELCTFRKWWNRDCSPQRSGNHQECSTGEPQPLLSEPPGHPQAQPPHKHVLLICVQRGDCAEGSALPELSCAVMPGHTKDLSMLTPGFGTWARAGVGIQNIPLAV